MQELFSQVWNVYKEECKEKQRITICHRPYLIVSIQKEQVYTFEKAVGKLKQIKFTELLFSRWSTLGDLIGKFLDLKKDFGPLVVDFRLRALRSWDSLREATIRIKFAIETHFMFVVNRFPIVQSNFCCFFIELINFIHFKCYIFDCDYRDESKRNYWNKTKKIGL